MIIAGILAMIFLTLACTNKNKKYAPESLKGYTLSAEYTSGRGSFDGIAGQTFKIVFKDEQNFYAPGKNGVVQFTGTYEYTRVKPDQARTFLMATSGPKSGTELKVDFYFKDSGKGTFDGLVAQGPKGSQTGDFELEAGPKE